MITTIIIIITIIRITIIIIIITIIIKAMIINKKNVYYQQYQYYHHYYKHKHKHKTTTSNDHYRYYNLLSEDVKVYMYIFNSKRYYGLNDRTINIIMGPGGREREWEALRVPAGGAPPSGLRYICI